MEHIFTLESIRMPIQLRCFRTMESSRCCSTANLPEGGTIQSPVFNYPTDTNRFGTQRGLMLTHRRSDLSFVGRMRACSSGIAYLTGRLHCEVKAYLEPKKKHTVAKAVKTQYWEMIEPSISGPGKEQVIVFVCSRVMQRTGIRLHGCVSHIRQTGPGSKDHYRPFPTKYP